MEPAPPDPTMWITGIGTYLPAEVRGNAHYARTTGLSEERIGKYAGILNRRIAAVEEDAFTMALAAARDCLAKANGNGEHPDLIISGSYTPSDTIGTIAHRVQRALKLNEARAIYLSTACSSMLNAVEVAEGYFASGKSSTCLATASEHNSLYNDESDPSSGHLWGDAGGAFLLSARPPKSGIGLRVLAITTHGHGADGRGPDGICLKPRNGGLKMPFGPEIFRQAVSKMTSVAREVLQSAGLSPSDIKYLVPHQANQRITDRVARELGFEPERIASVISEYGNTGSASVVLALARISGDLREGDYALLVTFGGGYSSAAMVLRAETAAAADSVAFGASAMQPDRIRAPNFVMDGPETAPCSQVTEMPPTTDSSIHCPVSTIPGGPTAVRTSIYSRRHTIKREADFIQHLVRKGGPEIADYHLLDAWFDRIHYLATVSEISSEELLILRRSFGVSVSLATLQGLVCNQPHGYAGDFEIIDRIYTRHISADPRLMRWDAYFHSQAGARAVRNRKAYFHRLLDRHYLRRKPLQVLKIASGPGRCMFEWLSARPEADVNFDCVELDSDAIAYASALNQEFLSRILFRRQNAVRFRPTSQYDLIWAAGLFDYFNDRVFKAVLCRLLAGIAEGGELVIGNFSPSRRARAYMEFGGWKLNNRTAETLRTLAQECGVVGEAIHVGAEPEGVNLFLHIRRDDRAKS